MGYSYKAVLMTVLAVMLSGCAGLKDVPATVWGSSTRVLEDKRGNAMSKTYEKGYWEVFRTAVKVLEKKRFVIFKKDEVRGLMIVMGVPGAVNTTEVGVFFVELNEQQTRVELTSLSTNAKRRLAKSLFNGIDVAFGLAKDEEQEGFNADEFKDGMTPEALLKTIEKDGFSVPSQETPLESLNLLLEDAAFYENWLNKYRNMKLTEDMAALTKLESRSRAQVMELNRYLLEVSYPSACPRSSHD